MIRAASIALALAAAAIPLPACSNPQTARSVPITQWAASSPRTTTPTPEPPRDPRALTIFRNGETEPADWSALIIDLIAAQVIILGEQHGHPLGGRVQTAIFEDLLALTPDTIALSLEFFERDDQTHIDDYLAGITDEETFRRAARRSTGNYPDAHRIMLEAARDAGRPVIAANAPRRYVRLARTDGLDRLDTLTPEQRRLVDPPDAIIHSPYRDRFFELMGAGPGHDTTSAHGMTAEQVETFFVSQSVWDETMSRSIAAALQRNLHPIVHIVGQFHSDYQGGLVERLRIAAPSASLRTISLVAEWSDAPRAEDDGRADWIIYTGPHPGH